MTANGEGVSASEVTVRWSTLLGAVIVPLAAAGIALWVSKATGEQRMDNIESRSDQRMAAIENRVESLANKAEQHRDRIDQRLGGIEQTLAVIREKVEILSPPRGGGATGGGR